MVEGSSEWLDRLVADGWRLSKDSPRRRGCGFWVTIDQSPEPAEWWECFIPDAEHDGRDHLLVRKVRNAEGAHN